MIFIGKVTQVEKIKQTKFILFKNAKVFFQRRSETLFITLK